MESLILLLVLTSVSESLVFGSFHVKSAQKKYLPLWIWMKLGSCIVSIETLTHGEF